MLAQINKKIDKQEIKKTMQMLGLVGENKKWVCRYSLGMKQRLALAQAFMENPEFLILDEPMNSLDREGVILVRNILNEKKREGKLIIISSHYQEDIDCLCDKTFFIEEGILQNDK